jgi:hypothetical protein
VRNFCDDDEDWASLALAAGDEVTIETAELGPFADTIVAILSPGCGLVLAEDDDTAGGRASRLSFTAPSAGSYRVRVRQSDGSSGPDRGYVLVRSRLIPRECGAFAQGVGEPSESPALLDLEVLDDGAIVMAGSVVDPVSGVLGWLVRGAAEGGFVPVTRFWQRELVAVANVGSGRTVVASWTDGDVPGAEDALALGLDDGGDVTWTKAWRLDDSGAARAFGVAAAGAEAIVGANVELASGDYAQLVHLARFGADGSMTWSRELRLGRALAGTSMASSPSGGVIVSARSAAGVAGAPVVMKVEADGALAWGVALDVDLVPGSASAAATSDGGAALAGVTAGGRLVVARLDASGSVTWSSAWDANGGFGTRMTKLSARGEFLVVLAEDVSTGSTWLARVDATGATVSQSLAWEGGARIDGLAIDRAGSVLLCGATTTGDGALLARLDAADRPPSGCAAAPTPLAIESPLAVASSALTIATRDVAPLMVARTPSAGPDWGLSADLCPCERLPPPLPTEVSPPGSPVPLRVTRRGLSWENAAANGSESFLVYRGELAELRVGTAGSCHASGAIAPSLMDDEDPPSGTGWFYLVAGRNAGGDGPLGDGGLGPRVPASACP